jgi:hypothetical protein
MGWMFDACHAVASAKAGSLITIPQLGPHCA